MSDVFSLGATLYTLLTGLVPPAVEEGTRARVPAAREVNRNVPPALEAICLKATAHNPEERYATAAELAGEIERWLADEPVKAYREPLSARAWREVRRRRTLVSSVVAGILVAALSLGVATFLLNRARENESQARVEAQKARGDLAIALGLQKNATEDARAAESRERERAAEARAAESRERERAAQLSYTLGCRLLEDGDWVRALVPFAQAVEVNNVAPELSHIHRVGVGMVLRQSPQLLQMWFHEGAVRHVEFSPDGRYLLTASDDRTARVWDLATGAPVTRPLRHGGRVLHATFSPDSASVATAGEDRVVRVWRLGAPEPVVREWPHKHSVRQVAFSKDGQRLVTYSREAGRENLDKTLADLVRGVGDLAGIKSGKKEDLSNTAELRIYDLRTGESLSVRSPDGIKQVVVGSDGKWALTVSESMSDVEPSRETVRAYDLATGKLLRSGPSKLPLSRVAVGPSPNVAVTMGMGNWATLWDPLTGRQIVPPLEHTLPVNHASFSPNGRLLATASGFGSKGGGQLNIAGFDKDGNKKKSAGVGPVGEVRIWDVQTGKMIGPVLELPSAAEWAQFTPDGGYVLSAGSGWTDIRCWEVPSGRPVPPRLGVDAYFNAVALDPTGRLLATADAAGTVRLWARRTGGRPLLALEQRDLLSTACFSPDGKQVLTTTRDRDEIESCEARLWDVRSGKVRLRYQEHKGQINHGAFSPDGKRVVTVGSGDRSARVWDAVTGRTLLPPLRHETTVTRAVFSPNGSLILTDGAAAGGGGWLDRLGLGGKICASLWDAKTGRPLPPVLKCNDTYSRDYPTFSPDGRFAVAVGSWTTIWDLGTGRIVASDEPTGPDDEIMAMLDLQRGPLPRVPASASWAPDSRRIATARHQNVATVSPPGPGTFKGITLQHRDRVSHVAFSPDGRRVVTTCIDRTARVWDSQRGEAVTPAFGHPGKIHEARFSPDSRLVVTASEDGTVRLWDAATGMPVSPPLRHIGAGGSVVRRVSYGPHQAEFTPDCRQLLSVGGNTVLIWDVSPEQEDPQRLLRLTQLMLGETLSPSGAFVPLEPAVLQRWWAEHRDRSAKAPGAQQVAALQWHRSEARACEAAGNWAAAAWHLERLAGLQPGDWEVHARLGEALWQANRFEEAIRSCRQGLVLHEGSWRVSLSLAFSLGNRAVELEEANEDEAAEAHLKEAIQIFGKLAAARPDDQGIKRSVALALKRLGFLYRRHRQTEKAGAAFASAGKSLSELVKKGDEKVYNEWLEAQYNCVLCLEEKQPDQAEAMYKILIDILRRWRKARPAETAYRRQLAEIHFRLANLVRGRDPRQAEVSYEAVIALLAEAATVHSAAWAWSSPRETVADVALALWVAQAQVVPLTGAAKEGVNDPVSRFRLAYSFNDLALLRKLKPGWAEGHLRKAIALYQDLSLRYLQDRACRENLAGAFHNLALLLRNRNDPEMETPCRKAIALREALVKEQPYNHEHRLNLAFSHHLLADVLSETAPKEAEIHYRKAIALRTGLLAERVPPAFADLWVSGAQPQAATPLLLALHSARLSQVGDVAGGSRGTDDPCFSLALTHYNLANLLRRRDQLAAAGAYQEVGKLLTARLAESPSDGQSREVLACAQMELGWVLVSQANRVQESQDSFRAARGHWERLAAQKPGNAEVQILRSRCYSGLAAVRLQLGEAKTARAALLRRLDILKEVERVRPKDARVQLELGDGHAQLVEVAWAGDDPESGLEAGDRARAAWQRGASFSPKSEAGKRDSELKTLDERIALLKDAQKAIQDRDFALKRPEFLPIRAGALARRGKLAEATATADKLAERGPKDQYALFQGARAYALCAATAGAANRDRYAASAVVLLRRAVEAGYDNLDHLRCHEDLTALRSLPDFRKLVAEVEDKKRRASPWSR